MQCISDQNLRFGFSSTLGPLYINKSDIFSFKEIEKYTIAILEKKKSIDTLRRIVFFLICTKKRLSFSVSRSTFDLPSTFPLFDKNRSLRGSVSPLESKVYFFPTQKVFFSCFEVVSTLNFFPLHCMLIRI